MAKETIDRRTVRTKKMIRNALSELIEEKGFNDISITDLTTRADINRGTFYLHYTDKYDLLEKIEEEIMVEIQAQVTQIDYIDVLNRHPIDKPISFIIKLFEYFKENAGLIKAILGPKGDPLFHKKIKKLMEINLFEKNIAKSIKKENLLIPENYFVSYMISAHLGVVQQWLESGMDKTPEEMALILSKMSILGPLNVAGIKKDII